MESNVHAFGSFSLSIQCIAVCCLCGLRDDVEDQSKPDSEAAARGEGRVGRAGCDVPAPG